MLRRCERTTSSCASPSPDGGDTGGTAAPTVKSSSWARDRSCGEDTVSQDFRLRSGTFFRPDLLGYWQHQL